MTRRRAGHIVRLALAALPLLLVCALWARSYWRLDVLWLVRDDGTTRAVAVRRGAVHVVATATNGRPHGVLRDAYRIPATTQPWPPTLHYPENLAWYHLGFGHVEPVAAPPAAVPTLTITGGGFSGTLAITVAPIAGTPGFGVDLVPWLAGRPYEEWVIPLWPIALLATAPTARVTWRAARRARRRRRGQCPACGYDLRGTPAGAGGALCPECGTSDAAGPAPDFN